MSDLDNGSGNAPKTVSHKLIYGLILLVIILVFAGIFVSQITKTAVPAVNNSATSSTNNQSLAAVPKTLPAILSVDPQSQTLKVGETFSVNIVLDTANTPINAVDIYQLHYNPAVLTVVDSLPKQSGIQILPGSLFTGNGPNLVDQKSGTIKFGQADVREKNFTGKGVLATINFKVLAAGTSQLKFDFTPGSTIDTNAAVDGKDMLGHVVDGIYTVTAK